MVFKRIFTDFSSDQIFFVIKTHWIFNTQFCQNGLAFTDDFRQMPSINLDDWFLTFNARIFCLMDLSSWSDKPMKERMNIFSIQHIKDCYRNIFLQFLMINLFKTAMGLRCTGFSSRAKQRLLTIHSSNRMSNGSDI